MRKEGDEGWRESRLERKEGVCVCVCVMEVGNEDSTGSHGPL